MLMLEVYMGRMGTPAFKSLSLCMKVKVKELGTTPALKTLWLYMILYCCCRKRKSLKFYLERDSSISPSLSPAFTKHCLVQKGNIRSVFCQDKNTPTILPT